MKSAFAISVGPGRKNMFFKSVTRLFRKQTQYRYIFMIGSNFSLNILNDIYKNGEGKILGNQKNCKIIFIQYNKYIHQYNNFHIRWYKQLKFRLKNDEIRVYI
jgi:hypothetical protein